MNFALGRLGGTEIRIHWTWVPILAFVAVVLGLDVTAGTTTWPPAVTWSAAAAAASLIMVSSIAHEMAHVVAVRRSGTPVPSVLIQFIGGPFVMGQAPRNASEELRLALWGPLVSIGITVACVVAGIAVLSAWPGETQAPMAAEGVFFIAFWLGFFNAFLAVVSLIPGYPFDGGRIVHAIAWQVTGSDERASRITGRFCRLAGAFMLGAGVVMSALEYAAVAPPGTMMIGLMLIIVGGQLLGSAGFVERRGVLQALLAPLRAGDALDTNTARVPAQVTLDVFASAYVGESAGSAAIVERGDEVVGLIGASQIRRIPQKQWRTTRTEQAMAPIAGIPVVAADAPLLGTMELFDRAGLDAIAVALPDGSRGLLTRKSVGTVVRARAEAEGRMDIFTGKPRKRGFRGR
jgi:Zn-dependent protease